ncbi:hypothetical protein DH2020_005185 [Rehmannia glutinosa]|uniref:GRF-type domain-containing protein n=1 Tax=Rehmannia glutinosa TaxID=99300 RepID=A0ABR0XS67_REHGL
MKKSSPSSSNSWNSRNNVAPMEDVYCQCGSKVVLKTSWIKNNPGRRFWACPNYEKGEYYGYFEWLDDEVCSRAKHVIPGLLAKLNKREDEMTQMKIKESKLEADLVMASSRLEIMKQEVNHLKNEVNKLKKKNTKYRCVLNVFAFGLVFMLCLIVVILLLYMVQDLLCIE